MREALSQILVLGGLLWVYGLILFGARRRKGGQAKGLFQRFTDPSDAPIASTALAVLAALELLPTPSLPSRQPPDWRLWADGAT